MLFTTCFAYPHRDGCETAEFLAFLDRAVASSQPITTSSVSGALGHMPAACHACGVDHRGTLCPRSTTALPVGIARSDMSSMPVENIPVSEEK